MLGVAIVGVEFPTVMLAAVEAVAPLLSVTVAVQVTVEPTLVSDAVTV